MLLSHQSEAKLNQFKEDIKNKKIFEIKLNYLIKKEFDVTLSDILLLEPDSFIERIEKGISLSLENIYTEDCLSDLKLKSLIEKLINNIKIEYSNIVQQLKEVWNTYEKNLKHRGHQEHLLTDFRKHCFNTNNLALHNCGISNSYFLIVKNNRNKINFVICESCKKVYYSSYILCRCSFCNIDYYSSILSPEENPDFLVATWEKYHCPQIINEKMKCIKCREFFYLDMKNGMLTCLNKKCRFISKQSRIIWTCSTCQEEFKSKVIVYNPLEIKVVKNVIKETLFLKHRAHPNKMPCCKLNVFFTEFFHKKACRGILYEGELNDNMIIVCEKCHAINLYERFIWTCPKCLRKFRDIKNNSINNNNINISSDKYVNTNNYSNRNNINNNYKIINNIRNNINYINNTSNNESNNNYNYIYTTNNNIGIDKKKEKSSSVSKEDNSCYKYRIIRNEKELQIEKRKDKNKFDKREKVKCYAHSIDEKNIEKKYDFKSKYESSRKNVIRNEQNSSNLTPVDSQKDKSYILLLKNECKEKNVNGSGVNNNKNCNINIYRNIYGRGNNNSVDKNALRKQLLYEKNFENKEDERPRYFFRKRNEKDNKKEELIVQKYMEGRKKRIHCSYDNSKEELNKKKNYKSFRLSEKDKKKEKKEEGKDNYKICYNINNNGINSNNISNNISNNVSNNVSRNISYVNININNNNNLQKNETPLKKRKILNKNEYLEDLENKINKIPRNKDEVNSPKKYIKRSRYNSVGDKPEIEKNCIKNLKENHYQDIRPKSRNNYIFHAITNIKKDSNDKSEKKDINVSNNNINYRPRFHIIFNQVKKDNKDDSKQNDNKKNEINKSKKEVKEYIDNDSDDVKVDDVEEDEDNKNTKENSNAKTKENENNKIVKRFGFKHIKVNTIGMEDKDDDSKNKNNKNNNNNNITSNNRNNSKNKNNVKNSTDKEICPAVPENAGLKNLKGFSEHLLIHIKKRINNIFLKCKIPLFDIEDYIFNKKIGQGSYGVIYSVNKQNQKTPDFALKKIIAKSLIEVSDFIKEFELVYSCDHPNIMKIYGYCFRILDNTTFSLYFLMEKSKCDWDKEIKSRLSNRKIYSEKELINILKQLTEALLFLKNKFNISHRDIKPQNILIFENGKYKLADFGEAKEVKISKQLNTLRGTELYMSPVLYEGLKKDKNDVKHDPFKSDVFSLGFCLLFAAGLNYNLLYQVRDLTDTNSIEKSINDHLKRTYSKTFIEMLCKMLKFEESKRIGFNELMEYINKNYN